jgi:flagellar motility protein MotE (MotC chaperone)
MFKFLAKIRIVPMTIFAAALMLSFKVSDILNGIETSLDAFSVAKVQAQQPPEAPPPPPANLPTNNAPPPEDGAPPPPPGSAPPSGDEPPANDTAQQEEEGDDPQDDPTLFTQTEIDLLQQLADRREKIEARSEEIDLRAGLLSAAEKRIDKKIQEMKSLEITIQKLIKTHDQQEEAKMESLVKIYENMKPKDAARIFEELDIGTLLSVAERMKERKLAPVMAKMNAQKAKEMTVELTKLRELPDPGT